MPRFRKKYAGKNGWTDWHAPHMDGYRMGCCDCGLVHDFEFKVVKRVGLEAVNDDTPIVPDAIVVMRAKRNNRSTARLRKSQNITVVKTFEEAEDK